MITCVCPSRNRWSFLQRAIYQFKSQSFAREKELLIIYDDNSLSLNHIEAINDPEIRTIKVPEILNIGQRRNLATNYARGDYICVWDDDDIMSLSRLHRQYEYMIAENKQACALNSVMLINMIREKYDISILKQFCCNTLLCNKDLLIRHRYEEVQQGGDVPVLTKLLAYNHLAVMSAPELYGYVYHGNNIWDEQHFEKQMRSNVKRSRWIVEKELIDFIIQKKPSGRLLEFGSGEGTNDLLNHYSVQSIEHNPLYTIKRSDTHQCYHAPLKGNWYDREVTSRVMEQEFDLILVDGPCGLGRRGILDNLDLFRKINCSVVFDDMDRQHDRAVMIEWCRQLGYCYSIQKGLYKEFGYCTRTKLMI